MLIFYQKHSPDSAMQLLNLLQCPEKLYGKERADYALLLTQILDRNYNTCSAAYDYET